MYVTEGVGAMSPEDELELSRHKAEAREVMRWPKEKRQRFYEQVAAKRGQEAATALIEEVQRQWHIDMMGQP